MAYAKARRQGHTLSSPLYFLSCWNSKRPAALGLLVAGGNGDPIVLPSKHGLMCPNR